MNDEEFQDYVEGMLERVRTRSGLDDQYITAGLDAVMVAHWFLNQATFTGILDSSSFEAENVYESFGGHMDPFLELADTLAMVD